jgi:hypothetical protein
VNALGRVTIKIKCYVDVLSTMKELC